MYNTWEELWSSGWLCPEMHCLADHLLLLQNPARESMPACEGTHINIYTHVPYPNTLRRWGTPAHKLVTLPPSPIPNGETLAMLGMDNSAGARAPLLTLLLAASDFPLLAL